MDTENGTVDSKGKVAVRTKTGRWAGSLPMLVLEVAETMTYFGVSSNLVTYMTVVLHQGVAESAKDVSNWSGTLFVSSLLGAFMSDAYWGRYKTMTISILLYCLGLISLTMSASLKSLRPAQCPSQNRSCPQPSTGQSAVFYLSIYLIAVSTGSLKANLLSFGADQFDESDDAERKQKYSFFNWFICSINIGGLIAVTMLVYIEDHVGWGWGFGILLAGIIVATPLFFLQTPRYRYRYPEGSPLTKVLQVLSAAFRKRHIVKTEFQKLHEKNGKLIIPQTNQFLFLNKAAVKTEETVETPWTLCTVTQVEETKLVVRMIPIWFSTLMITISPLQSLTFFVRQGMTMNNRLGSFKVPPASMLVFSNLSQIIFMSVYDRIMVPFFRKHTKNERGISLLQKLGFGMAVCGIGIGVAAFVEMMRRKATHELSIFWLVPQYVILGVGEGVASAGIFEFFHDQAPDSMQSLGISFALANFGVGSFLSSATISCVKAIVPNWLQDDINKGHVDYYYWILAGLIAVNMAFFYLPVACWFSYKRTKTSSEETSDLVVTCEQH